MWVSKRPIVNKISISTPNKQKIISRFFFNLMHTQCVRCAACLLISCWKCDEFCAPTKPLPPFLRAKPTHNKPHFLCVHLINSAALFTLPREKRERAAKEGNSIFFVRRTMENISFTTSINAHNATRREASLWLLNHCCCSQRWMNTGGWGRGEFDADAAAAVKGTRSPRRHQ